MAEQPATNGGQAPPEEKKKRGKPKDEHAPPKPKNPYSRFAAEARPRLKETRPELLIDLSAMGKAIAEEWAVFPEAKKAEWAVEYEKEMEVWRPKWAAYKETRNYKDFVEVKTDWLDKRAQKKLVKTMNKDAPKRPKSGYMIFAGTVRESIMEKVKAENLGLAAAATMIGERWNALSEGQKAEFGEQALRQKIEFDKEFAVYKQTEAFGAFCDGKAKLESTQQQKKLIRTHMDDAPKKALSGYAIFRAEVMPGILKENGEKKEGEGKLTMGDMGKKVSELWKALSEEKQSAYNEKAVPLKEEYDKAFRQFKASEKYTTFLEKRQKVKARENLLVNLREMPKRPKSVFAMFAAEHKDEVPAGKGEGKGVNALKQKFAVCPIEEKKKYEEQNSKLTEQWKEKVTEFKAGPKYQTFETTRKKIMLEFKNEAIKVTTLKFLHEAPPAPAKTSFAIFVGEKRKAAGEAEGQRKSKEQKREEVKKAQEEWLKLDKGIRDGYESKRKDLLRAYEGEVKTFCATERWQEYQKEAKRLRIPIKSLLYHKKKIIKKTKDGKLSPASVQLPEKPDLFPSRPKNAMQIFIAEKRKTVDAISQIHEMWTNLSPEDKAPFDKQAADQAVRYAEQLKEFKASDEGKLYFRQVSGAQRRRNMIAARNKYLDDLPKKPTSAVFEWMKQNAKTVKKAEPELKGFQLREKLTKMWSDLSEEEKEPFNKAAADRAQQFTENMTAFKASDNWKRYVMATKVRKFGAGKAKGKAAPGGVKAPEAMPKKPSSAFQAFQQDQVKAGTSGQLGEMHKRFAALPAEEKQKYLEEAREREAQYKQEMQAFESSIVGRKFRMASAAFAKRKKLNDLRARFLKDEPAKPKGAFHHYAAANRERVQAENPDLKGIGAVQGKLNGMFRELSEADRQKYIDMAKEEQEVYTQKLAEFKGTEDYKKYEKMSRSVQMGGKAKAKVKAKVKTGPQMPAKPDNLPKPALNAMLIFGEETRASGGPRGMAEQAKLWRELGAEGQKKYNEKAKEMKEQHDKEMRIFSASAEGKKYNRETAAFQKRRREEIAKAKFLSAPDQPKEPKRPPGAYFLFLSDRRANSSGDTATKASEFSKEWSAMSAEQKKKFEDDAKQQKEKYDEELEAYRNSKGFKMFEKFTGVKKKVAKVKMAKRAKAAISGRGTKRAAAPAGRGGARAAPKAAAKKTGGGSSDQMGSDSKSSKKSSSSSSKKSSSSSSSKSD